MKLPSTARRHTHIVQAVGLVLAVALTLISSLALSKAVAPPSAATATSAASDGDGQGELIGDLVFHADLLSALDRLCPQADPTDWHGALRPLLDQAFTPELRELSRRLGTDAGAQLVHARGGCRTSGFGAAYNESKDEYRSLLQRWRSAEGQ
jgi:hypothetical protein